MYDISGNYELGAYELGNAFDPSEIELVRALAASGYAPNGGAYYLGAAPQGAPLNAGPVGPALGRPPMRVVKKDPETPRVLFLGFKSSAAIAAGASANVSASPQDTLAPRKIIIPETVAPNFEVNDIRIGTISQLSSSDPVPAEAFIPGAVASDVKFDTAQVSQQITFNVTNISGAPQTFRAAINGFVARL